MRVTKQTLRTRATPPPSNRWLILIALALAFGLGFIVAQAGWHRQLGELAGALARNPRAVWAAWRYRVEIPALSVDLDFEDYQRLSAKHTRALQMGANLASDADYVPATLTLDTAPVDVLLRLPEADASAFSGEYWPLELVVDAGQPLFGVRWATTLIPVDEAALLARGYLSMMQELSMPVLHHCWVYLTVNGARWGLYAFEEVPSTEMLTAQGFSPDSVVVWFDQHEFLAAQAPSGDGSFAYAQIEVAYTAGGSQEDRLKALSVDARLAAIRADVVNKLRALEQGDVAPTQVFDAEVWGRFLAITTLWYGSPMLDWRSLRLAYDPGTRRFSPIATGAAPDSATPLPVVLLDDPAIQRAYVENLAIASDAEFLSALSDAGWGEDPLWLAWRVDLGQFSSPLAVLAGNQAKARAILSPPRTLFAEVTEEAKLLRLRLEAVLPFPVEVLGLDLGERGFLPLDLTWVGAGSTWFSAGDSGMILRARVSDAPVVATLQLPLSALPVAMQGTPDELRLVTRIWGLDEQILAPVTWEEQ